MSKETNNIRNKKLHSTKPYEIRNSIVRKVSSLLPQTSWFTRWFTSTSIPEDANNDLTNDGNHIDTVTRSPHRKHASLPLDRTFPANSFHVSPPTYRGESNFWANESLATVQSNVTSDGAGPSGLGRTPISTVSYHSPKGNIEGLEGKLNGESNFWANESLATVQSNVTSDGAGPSGLGRTPISTVSYHSPKGNIEGLEGKLNGDGGSDSSESTSGCSSLPPKTAPSNLNTPIQNSKGGIARHVQSSHFSLGLDKPVLASKSTLNQQRPSPNVSPFGRQVMDTSKLSRESSLTSPFYKGRTMYGGASAYRRPSTYLTHHKPLPVIRREIRVRPVNEKLSAGASAEASMSDTAKRILEAIEYFSTPASDARRMPLSESLRKDVRNSGGVHSSTRRPLPPAATRCLTIPTSPDRLRLYKLQDVTEAARKVAQTLPSKHYSLRAADKGDWQPQFGKATKSRPIDEEELPTPVNLPNVPLSISTLPSFNFFSPLVKSTPNSSIKIIANGSSENSKKLPDLTGGESPDEAPFCSNISGGPTPNIAVNEGDSKVIRTSLGENNAASLRVNSNVLTSNIDTSCSTCNREKLANVNESSKIVVTSIVNSFKGRHNFCFSQPNIIGVGNEEISPVKVHSFDFAQPEVLDVTEYYDTLKHVQRNGFHKHCVSNTQEKSGPVQVLNSADITSYSKQNEKSDATVQNSSSTSGLKENNGWGAKFIASPHTWVCSTCMIRNKMDTVFCVCCGVKKPDSVDAIVEKREATPPVSIPSKASWGQEFKLQPDAWECTTCFVRNKKDDSNCIACSTPQSDTTAVILPPRLSGEALKSGQSMNEKFGVQFQLLPGTWECTTCLVRNKKADLVCVACTVTRPGVSSEKTVAVTPLESTGSGVERFKKSTTSWECPVCMIQNKNIALNCAACQERKPGTSDKGSSSGSTIKFNFDIPSEASAFKFGIDKAYDNLPSESSSVDHSYGSPSVSSSGTSTFVVSSTTTNSKVPSNIVFGVPSPEVSNSQSVPVVSGESVSAGSVPAVTTSDVALLRSVLMNKPVPLTNSTSKLGNVSFGIPAKNRTVSYGDKNDFKFGVMQAAPDINNAGKDAVLQGDRTGLNSAVPKIDLKIGDPGEKRTYIFRAPTVVTDSATHASVTPVTSTSCVNAVGFSTPAVTNAVSAATTTAISAGTTVNKTSYSSVFSPSVEKVKEVNLGTKLPAKPSGTSLPTFSFSSSTPQSPAGAFTFNSSQPATVQQSGEGFFNSHSNSTSKPLFGGWSNTWASGRSIFGGATSSAGETVPSTSSFGLLSPATTPTTTAATTTTTTTASTTTTNPLGFGNSSSAPFGTTKTSGNLLRPIATQRNITNTSASKASVFSFGSAPNASITTTSATSTSPSFGAFSSGENNPSPHFGNTGIVTPSGSVFGVPGHGSSLATTSPSAFGGNAGSIAGSFCPSINFGSEAAPQQFNFGSSSQTSSTQLSGSHGFSHNQPQVSSSFAFTPRETPQATSSFSFTPRETPQASSFSFTPRGTPQASSSFSFTPRETPQASSSFSFTPRETPQASSSFPFTQQETSQLTVPGAVPQRKVKKAVRRANREDSMKTATGKFLGT